MEIVRDFSDKVIKNVEKVIVGKRSSVEATLLALLCQGHVLLKMRPAPVKRFWPELALSIGCSFRGFNLHLICYPAM
jgi:MoxR-like ATPase